MSQTRTEALRTTKVDDQTGSKFARSAWGTKRSVRAAARCEIAGVGSPLLAATARALPPAFRNDLRFMMPSPLHRTDALKRALLASPNRHASLWLECLPADSWDAQSSMPPGDGVGAH